MKVYWIVLVMGVIIIGMLVFMSMQSKDATKLQEDVAATEGLLADAKATRVSLNREFDAKKHQAKVKARTVSATKIANEMIAVDNALTTFYKTNEPLPSNKAERDRLLKRLDKMKEENTRLTGASDADHIKTWQLNPKWSLKLESVVTYQDTDFVPVVFSMKTKSGKSAGLIYAIYDVNDHQLDNINRYYTTVGLEDEVDVGGM